MRTRVSLFVLIGLMVSILAPSASLLFAQDRGCAINAFYVSPSGTVVLYTHVSLSGQSNCGTSRFEIDGVAKAETGQGNNYETWLTEESGVGSHNVCFVARGNNGWDGADRWCQTVTVIAAPGQSGTTTTNQPAAAPPQGSSSQPTGQVQYYQIWRQGVSDLNNGCSISQFSLSPNQTSYSLGTHISLEGWSNCSTVRFEIINIHSGQIWYKSEIGSSHQSEVLKTEEFPADTYQVCFVAHKEGWYAADHWCKEVGFGVSGSTNPSPTTGQTSPPVVVNPPPSSGNANPSSSGVSSNPTHSGAACYAPEPVAVGYRARVKYDPPLANNVRSDHRSSASLVGQLQPGEQFLVSGGPVCEGGYRWWYVESDSGINGWTADGDNSVYWIEVVEMSHLITLGGPCNLNPYVEWYYQNQTDYFVFDVNAPSIALGLFNLLLDAVDLMIRAEEPIPTSVEAVDFYDNSSDLFITEIRWYDGAGNLYKVYNRQSEYQINFCRHMQVAMENAGLTG